MTYWKDRVEGTKPRLTIEERADRDGDLYLLWWSGGRRRRPKLEDSLRVRDANGELSAEHIMRVKTAALRQYRTMQSDTTGGAGAAAFTPEPTAAGTPMTLSEARDLAVAVPAGRHARKGQEHSKSKLALERALDILAETRVVDSLRPSDYTLIWREFARNYATWGLDWRMAEQTVSELIATLNWLYDEGHVQSPPRPPRNWKQKLATEWEAITGRPARARRPKHTAEELRKLLHHLPDADPRLQLFAECGLELRGGQVIRGQRSDLDLTPGEGMGYGVLRVRGRGKKLAPPIYLTLSQRAAVDHALGPCGYLAAFEKLYLSDEIEDYPLWPGGALRDGKAVPREKLTQMNRRTLLQQFCDLEAIAGVKHVPRRGLYGLRRLMARLVKKETKDSEVRDVAGGWSTTGNTRLAVYDEDVDPEVLVAAAQARFQARQKLRGEEAERAG